MAQKRALVVDDSRTARESLAKLLAGHDLEVAFAETGEEALDFLHHQTVDVVFMDHTMPGMDGLEAVAAMKANPRTATIPVMMYTTREGEVYVSQARALGAVGVLPKQVQPGVLFDMLKKLGLIGERRRRGAAPDEAPRRRLDDLVSEVDREYDQRASGVALQTVLTRVLQAEHQKLRGEILEGQRRIARDVAAEIVRRHDDAARVPPRHDGGVEAAGESRRPTLLAVASAALAAAVLVLTAVVWTATTERDAARLELARLNHATRSELDALARHGEASAARLQARHRETLVQVADALTWSLNLAAPVAFDQPPFDDVAAERLGELLARLGALGFAGRVLLTAELAPFCLSRDSSGALVPAQATLPLAACDVLGHPLYDPGSLAALQSTGFAAALEDAARYPQIDVVLGVSSPEEITVGMPSNVGDAGTWNGLAGSMNRLSVRIEAAAPRA